MAHRAVSVDPNQRLAFDASDNLIKRIGESDADTARVPLRFAARVEHERVCAKYQRFHLYIPRCSPASDHSGSSTAMETAAT